MLRTALLLPLASLALACSGTPADPAASSTSAAAEPSATSTSTSTTGAPLVEPPPTPEVEPTPTPSVEPPAPPREPSNASTTFQLLALREGPLTLAVWQDQPTLLAGGVPIAIGADGTPQPQAKLAEGLEPVEGMSVPMFDTLAFAGSLDGEAWVTTRQEYDRAAAEYDVYAWTKGRWKRQKLEQGPIVEFYPAYVEREGALLGLRAQASNPLRDTFEFDDDTPKAERFRKDLAAALASAPQGFVHLSGPAPTALPELPRKLDLLAAATTRDGTLYALGQPPVTPEQPDEETGSVYQPARESVLLVWPPGQQVATEVSLRGSTSTSMFASGDAVLVGDESLLVVQGTKVEVVDLRGVPDHGVHSAARSPAGDLWLVVGDYARGAGEPSDNLWFRAAPTSAAPTPSWSRVSLPRPRGPIAEVRERWVWDPEGDIEWSQRERAELATIPVAESVFFARDTAWVVADLGSVWGSDHFMNTSRFVGLFGNPPTEVAPVEIEALDITQVRQQGVLAKRLEPGSAKCRFVAVSLGTPEQAEAMRAKADSFELESDGVGIGDLYVGELSGKRELILGLLVIEQEAVADALTKVREHFGVPEASADCRPRVLVEMLVDS
jgi:hypothetical protein